MSELTAARLRELLHYDPETGQFTRLVTLTHSCRVGEIAGCSSKGHGYWMIWVDGKRYYAHRLAWLYVTGDWPKLEVDHRNGSRVDNRWENLREASVRLNRANQMHARSDSATGIIGVTRSGKKFIAQTGASGRTRYLGTFDSPEDARQAYLAAKLQIYGDFVSHHK